MARDILARAGIPVGADFHTLDSPMTDAQKLVAEFRARPAIGRQSWMEGILRALPFLYTGHAAENAYRMYRCPDGSRIAVSIIGQPAAVSAWPAEDAE